jgi:hypothetical protein
MGSSACCRPLHLGLRCFVDDFRIPPAITQIGLRLTSLGIKKTSQQSMRENEVFNQAYFSKLKAALSAASEKGMDSQVR